MKERAVKPGLPLSKIGHVEAFAMIVVVERLHSNG